MRSETRNKRILKLIERETEREREGVGRGLQKEANHCKESLSFSHYLLRCEFDICDAIICTPHRGRSARFEKSSTRSCTASAEAPSLHRSSTADTRAWEALELLLPLSCSCRGYFRKCRKTRRKDKTQIQNK